MVRCFNAKSACDIGCSPLLCSPQFKLIKIPYMIFNVGKTIYALKQLFEVY